MEKLNARRIGLTYAGSFLGAGYVSGQELWQFFGSFGRGGLFGLALTMALLATFGSALMMIVSHSGSTEMDRVLVPWEKLSWLRHVSAFLQIVLLFGVAAIMYAGGGALVHQLIGLPAWLGSAAMMVFVTIIAMRGLRGTVDTYSLIVPIMVLLTVIFGVWTLARHGIYIPPMASTKGSNPLMTSWVVGSVTFSFYNFFGSVGILAPLGGEAASPKAARGGIAIGTTMLIAIALSVLLALMACPEATAADLPMLVLAGNFGKAFGYLYGILLFLSMYGSAISMTVAITTYAMTTVPKIAPKRKTFIVCLGLCAFAASLGGFGDLISVIYPMFGYFSSLFIVCLVIHAIQVLREKKLQKAETKSDEGTSNRL